MIASQTLDATPGKRAQPGSTILHEAPDSVSHARLPEAPEVIRHLLGTGIRVGFGREECGNIIRHRDQSFDIHRVVFRRQADGMAGLNLALRSARMRACQASGCSTLTTSTAVTLYSGQLVAQSEFSVVTTLTPDSGKWNVV